jgi:tRNA-dihydrouridine synthase
VKIRMGFHDKDLVAKQLIPRIFRAGAAAVTV